MKRVRFTAAARQDLREIWKYIERRGDAVAADSFADRLNERFVLLAQSPLVGRPRRDVEPECRSFPIGAYLVYYMPETGGIEVVRVLHGKRDQATAFRTPSGFSRSET